jgi:hypothetical protein
MKKIDFINLITTYASHFRDRFRKKSVDKVLADFINYVAAEQGVDYGIYASELEKHKRRVYNPSDSDVIMSMSRKISDYERVIHTLYINAESFQAKALIEHVAEMHSMDLERDLMISSDELTIPKLLAEELKKHIEHPMKPGYKRHDIIARIKELEDGN